MIIRTMNLISKNISCEPPMGGKENKPRKLLFNLNITSSASARGMNNPDRVTSRLSITDRNTRKHVCDIKCVYAAEISDSGQHADSEQIARKAWPVVREDIHKSLLELGLGRMPIPISLEDFQNKSSAIRHNQNTNSSKSA